MTDLVTIRFSNGILCCLSGTQPDNHYLNWCIVHYRIPRFNRVSITWNTETSGAKACTLTHVWRFNPTEMAFLLDAAARPYRCIGNQQRRREGGSGAQTCKTLLDDAPLVTVPPTLSGCRQLLTWSTDASLPAAEMTHSLWKTGDGVECVKLTIRLKIKTNPTLVMI